MMKAFHPDPRFRLTTRRTPSLDLVTAFTGPTLTPEHAQNADLSGL
jgi:hypothetical protein